MKMIDLHCDTIAKLLFDKKANLKDNEYQVDIKKLKAAESSVQFFALFAPPMFCEKEGVKANNQHELVLEMYDVFKREIDYNDDISFAKSYEDIINNEKANKISAFLTIEGMGSLESKLDRVKEYYDMGFRLFTLTWNYINSVGYPNVPDENMSKGLTDFGIKVVKKMNELGILIDVSHLSDQGFWDVIKYSNKPIVASHSNARALGHHVRNLTDDMLIALKENGGITGINFCSAFLTEDTMSKEMYVYQLVDQIEYIKDLVGIDVIALGTDFDGIGGTLEISDISKMHLLKDELRKRKFTEEEIEKIWYKNALRVIKEVL